MALSLALTLAGFKSDEYSNLVAHLTSENDGNDARPPSPSTRSDSSGVSSLASSTRHTTAASSPMSSRPETPNEDHNINNHELLRLAAKNVSAIGSSRSEQTKYQDGKERSDSSSETDEDNQKRDILDLMTNIRDPGWKVTHPDVKSGIRNFMENRSVYFRLSEDALSEDYPIRECKQCNFREPSPYLCR